MAAALAVPKAAMQQVAMQAETSAAAAQEAAWVAAAMVAEGRVAAPMWDGGLKGKVAAANTAVVVTLDSGVAEDTEKGVWVNRVVGAEMAEVRGAGDGEAAALRPAPCTGTPQLRSRQWQRGRRVRPLYSCLGVAR